MAISDHTLYKKCRWRHNLNNCITLNIGIYQSPTILCLFPYSTVMSFKLQRARENRKRKTRLFCTPLMMLIVIVYLFCFALQY